MTVMIGNFSLSLAVLVAMIGFLTALAALRFDSAAILRAARWTIAAFFGLLTISSACLMTALVRSDFRLDYVTHYTERALPFGYKLAAFWAGQEGSLLLWAWLLAAMSTLAAFTIVRKHRSGSVVEPAATLASLAVVCGFFAALMLFAANPFQVGAVTPSDGHGLNPMLQDPGMIAHPPMLFLGYAGYTIPFAMMIGALVAGRKDNEWIITTRRWALASWLMLSIGILLGAQWAYVELGWGGYWAWDPVENASLLPWLTGTALLHSIMVQQHRGMFKKWNAALIAITFVLCIFGTYLTRSGVIDSVHAFGASLIGTFFLVFLVLSILFSIVLLTVRRKLLVAEQELDNLTGKEGFFLATNVLLVGMTVITLIGTIFPLISEALAGEKVTVGPNFYNKVVAPLGMLLTAIMATGPLLSYGKEAAAKLLRGSVIPGLLAAVSVVIALASGLRNGWALLATAITVFAIVGVLVELIGATIARSRSHGETFGSALLHLLDGNHRRYGGQIVHIGIVMIIVGITGSSLFSIKDTFSMKQGDSVRLGDRTLTLTSVKPVTAVNYEAMQASLLITDAAGGQNTIAPQIRQYNKWEQLNSEVSINSNWKEDVYVTLAASDGEGGVTIQAIINPLVSWIWTGGIVLTLGGLLALLPRMLTHPVVAESPVEPVRVEPVAVESKGSTKNAGGRKRRRGRVGVQVST